MVVCTGLITGRLAERLVGKVKEGRGVARGTAGIVVGGVTVKVGKVKVGGVDNGGRVGRLVVTVVGRDGRLVVVVGERVDPLVNAGKGAVFVVITKGLAGERTRVGKDGKGCCVGVVGVATTDSGGRLGRLEILGRLGRLARPGARETVVGGAVIG